MKYTIIPSKRVNKFINKHRNNKQLLKRIYNEYIDISINPYNSKYKQLKSTRCPYCKRAKIGNYRIIFIIKDYNVYVIDIFHRKEDYMFY